MQIPCSILADELDVREHAGLQQPTGSSVFDRSILGVHLCVTYSLSLSTAISALRFLLMASGRWLVVELLATEPVHGVRVVEEEPGPWFGDGWKCVFDESVGDITTMEGVERAESASCCAASNYVYVYCIDLQRHVDVWTCQCIKFRVIGK